METTEESYNALLNRLYGLQRAGIKYTLENIQRLLEYIDNPYRQWPAIHLAGTNGKGSTANIIASILSKAGYKTGLYTSPHLVNFTERIRVNGIEISPEDVTQFMEIIQPAIDKVKPSFFEVTTAMAFWEFARQKVDIAVIETGLGGRLDSTNVVTPLISVITPIGMDHSDYLGDTLEAIAVEKAGIIKEGIPCITSNRNKEVLKVFRKKCKDNHSSFRNIFDYIHYRILSEELNGSHFQFWTNTNPEPESHFLSLAGVHQIENALLAIGTLDMLSEKLPVSSKAITEGLTSVRWPGRLDIIHHKPEIIVDVSHNSEGIAQTIGFLRGKIEPENTTTVLLLQQGKPYEDIVKQLSEITSDAITVDMPLGKPVAAEQLNSEFGKHHIESNSIKSIAELKQKTDNSDKNKTWLIIGSHYLAGEVYNCLHLS